MRFSTGKNNFVFTNALAYCKIGLYESLMPLKDFIVQALAGKTNTGGRFSTVDLLIKVAYLQKVNYIFNAKWS